MIDKILHAADKLSELYGNEEWVASEREPTIKILQELVEGAQTQTTNSQSDAITLLKRWRLYYVENIGSLPPLIDDTCDFLDGIA